MAHFAEINQEGIVLRVISAEQGFIDSGAVGNPNNWIQTSYNTYHGKHKNEKDGKKQLRKNFAGIGFKYDNKKDHFQPPQPYSSWLLNDEIADWEPPVPMPDDGNYYAWDEDSKSWIVVDIKIR